MKPKITIIGAGIYAEYICSKLQQRDDDAVYVSARDYTHVDSDLYILVCKPTVATSIYNEFLQNCSVIDATPAHRYDPAWEQVNIFTRSIQTNKISMMGCMATVASIFLNHVHYPEWVDTISLEAIIGRSVTGDMSRDENKSFPRSHQSDEIGKHLSIYPRLDASKLSGITIVGDVQHDSFSLDQINRPYRNNNVMTQYDITYNPIIGQLAVSADNFGILQGSIEFAVDQLVGK